VRASARISGSCEKRCVTAVLTSAGVPAGREARGVLGGVYPESMRKAMIRREKVRKAMAEILL
jgi:hypothetical protein